MDVIFPGSSLFVSHHPAVILSNPAISKSRNRNTNPIAPCISSIAKLSSCLCTVLQIRWIHYDRFNAMRCSVKLTRMAVPYPSSKSNNRSIPLLHLRAMTSSSHRTCLPFNNRAWFAQGLSKHPPVNCYHRSVYYASCSSLAFNF